MKPLDPSICHRALQSRDRRFDGRLFVGVTSTGIYCRPVCPAKTAKIENCKFFPTAVAAQSAGFRPCLRCRPEIAPEARDPNGASDTVTRALALITEGYLDEEGASVDSLAEKLGIGERQLRRLFEQHVGASPLSVAQTRRVLLAKQLLHETDLSMLDLAMAAGFTSLRRFNDTFKTLFHRSPSELRRQGRTRKGSGSSPQIRLFISYHPPYDWERIIAHLKARAIEGVEEVTNEKYRRAICLQGAVGIIEVSNNAVRSGLDVMIQFPALRRLSTIIHRLRMLFDVYADTNLIDTHLSSDPLMAKLVAQHPGLRVPGSWNGFELAVRAILGQQVTVQAAQKLAAKLVRMCHGPFLEIQGESLIYAFPSPSQLALAALPELGMPEARKNTLRAMANAVAADPNFFDTSISLEETVRRLRSIPGVGEWTAQYIALRAFRETDAFPATDVAILRNIALLKGGSISPKELIRLAERWRPWRAYAAQHLWAAGGKAPSVHPVSSQVQDDSSIPKQQSGSTSLQRRQRPKV